MSSQDSEVTYDDIRGCFLSLVKFNSMSDKRNKAIKRHVVPTLNSNCSGIDELEVDLTCGGTITSIQATVGTIAAFIALNHVIFDPAEYLEEQLPP